MIVFVGIYTVDSNQLNSKIPLIADSNVCLSANDTSVMPQSNASIIAISSNNYN